MDKQDKLEEKFDSRLKSFESKQDKLEEKIKSVEDLLQTLLGEIRQ